MMNHDIIQSIDDINNHELTNTVINEEGYIYDLFKKNIDNSIIFNLISKDCNYIKIHVSVNSGINISEISKRQYVRVSGFLKIEFEHKNGGASPSIQIEATKIEIISQFTTQIFKTEQLPIPDIYQIGKERIAVITGSKNKGYNDLESKVFPGIKQKLLKVPVPLQKKNSIDTITNRIKSINEKNTADLICIVRGGGEEAFIGYIFDSEPISLAIQNSKIPVLVAIGHADDATLADMVSDAPSVINPKTNEKERRFFTTPTDLAYFLNEELKKHFQKLPSERQDIPNTLTSNIPTPKKLPKENNSKTEKCNEKHIDYFKYLSYIAIIAIIYFFYQIGIFTDFYENTWPTIKNYSFAAFLVIGVIIILYNIYAILGLALLYFLFQFALHLIEGTNK